MRSAKALRRRRGTERPSARRWRRTSSSAAEQVLALQTSAGNRATTAAIGPSREEFSAPAVVALRRVLGTDVPGNRFPGLWAPTRSFFVTFVPSLPELTGGGRVHRSLGWPQSVLPTDAPAGLIPELSGPYAETLADALEGVASDRIEAEVRGFVHRARRAWALRDELVADVQAAAGSVEHPHPTMESDLRVYRAFERRLILGSRSCVLRWC